MKTPLFTGSGVAIVTPFTKETVDLPTLGRLLDFQLQNGTDAVIVCGTTGEASTMTYRERMRAIEFCVEHVDGRVPVIAGSGSNSTEIALALSRDASPGRGRRAAGGDALLQQGQPVRPDPPLPVIADAVEVPLILYDVPSRTGVSIAPETYAELAKHPNINGVKEAAGNLSNIQKTRNLCPEDFSIWSGNDDETAAICLLGGRGVISVAANVVPAEMHRLTELCFANDFAAAGELQLELKDLCDALFCDVNPIPVKTALNLMGWEVGPLRLPLCRPRSRQQRRRTLPVRPGAGIRPPGWSRPEPVIPRRTPMEETARARRRQNCTAGPGWSPFVLQRLFAGSRSRDSASAGRRFSARAGPARPSRLPRERRSPGVRIP